jgi:hypothetical protein
MNQQDYKSNLNIAIFYTGQLRSYKKCIQYLKKNILFHQNSHIFATLEPNKTETVMETETILKTHLSSHLKSLVWFNNNDETFNNHRNKLIENCYINYNNKKIYLDDLNSSFKVYLKNSGTITEIFQYYISYQEMKQYEEKNNINYDYIIRIRTDIVLCKEIDFSFLQLTNKDIENRILKIKETFFPKDETIYENQRINNKYISLIMNSLLDENRIYSQDVYYSNFVMNNFELYNIFTFQDLNNYIKNGNYILTIRKNLFFLIKRNFFNSIHDLYLNYGTIHFETTHNLNYYFWDAETQFEKYLQNKQINKFDSTHLFEDQSLYQYDKNKYFLQTFILPSSFDNQEQETTILNPNINDIYLFICRDY